MILTSHSMFRDKSGRIYSIHCSCAALSHYRGAIIITLLLYKQIIFNTMDHTETQSEPVTAVDATSLDCYYSYEPVELSDLTLVIDTTRFKVHKMQLARVSPVWKHVFQLDQECTEIDVSGRCSHTVDAMRTFLDELYSLKDSQPPSLSQA